MPQYNFGAGFLTIVPPGATPTPVKVGVLQEVSLETSFTIKELRGAYQFPVDIARGAAKASGKAKFAQLNSGLWLQVLSGGVQTTGQVKGIEGELPGTAGAIPATPFQLTVANGATFKEDLGVVCVETGVQFTRVVSAPAAGQYAVSAAGVYTFASADNVSGLHVAISYSYTVAASGKTIAYANQLMGAGTVIGVAMFNTFRGKSFGLRMNAATLTKHSLPFKNDDYAIQDIEYEAFADGAGNVLSEYQDDL